MGIETGINAARIADPPDTDELLLREVEGLVASARASVNAGKWGEAALAIGFASVQASRLAEYLQGRVTSLASNPSPTGELV